MNKMTVMLVDDEERFLETTQKLLARKGITALTASSGMEALESLRTHTVHVVILDMRMPGMDGMTTLKEIKRLFPMVEVIVLTGHATVESAVEGLQSGASDYLMKPADPDELILKARAAFAKREQLEEKIRVVQSRRWMGTAREILRETDGSR